MERLKGKSRKFKRKARSFVNQLIRYSKHYIRWHALSATLRSPESTPRIRQLLFSNEPPTEAEVDLILDAIARYEASAGRIRSTLASLGSKETFGASTISYGLAQFKLAKVNIAIARHKRVLSPIRRLPFEVLEMILGYSLFDEYPDNVTDHICYWVASIPLSQSFVCKFWRNVALSSPRLWSYIPTILLDIPYSRTLGFLEFFENVLERRCGNIPVSFHITTMDLKSDIVLPHPAVTLLVLHSNKWKTAILDMSWIRDCDLMDIRGRMPLLETLVLSIRLDNIPSDKTIDAFQIAPQLREVIFLGGEPPNLLLPHSQLLSYRHLAPYNPRVASLTSFTSLRTLELGPDFKAFNWCSGQVVTLSNLTTLKLSILRQESPNSQLPLLEILDLPALMNLSVDHSWEQGHSSILSLIIDLIVRSKIPPLEKLHVRARFNDEQAGTLVSLLQYIPMVTHLNIDLPHIEDLMQFVQTDDAVAPRLQACTFFIDRLLTIDEANICRELALRRGSPPVCLRTLTIQFIRSDRSDDPGNGEDVDFAKAQLGLLNGWVENNVSVYLKACEASIQRHLYYPEKVRQPISSLNFWSTGNHCVNAIHSLLSSILEMEVTQASDIHVYVYFSPQFTSLTPIMYCRHLESWTCSVSSPAAP